MKINKSREKRNDIQGIRAIAIIGVLLFHLSPKRFTNGFLGVDIFFVLSGYLMTVILERETTIDGKILRNFFIRRFKRIAPLYSVMLAFLTVVTPIVFLPSDMSHFITELKWALPFAENMQNVLKKHDYWEEIFNSPVLLHAWSLGVEMQYYLLVPFIMMISRSGRTFQFRISTILMFLGGSYVIHFFSSTSVSFGLIFARVWQFLTGTLFFELERICQWNGEYQAFSNNDHDESSEHTDGAMLSREASFTTINSFLSFCVTTSLFWMIIFSTGNVTLSRLLATFACGIIVFLGKNVQNWILSNEIMVYIGDISYVVYLAHWPVIILYKYYSDITDLTIPGMSFCLILILFISVLLHHSLERFFIASSTAVSAFFVAVVYLTIIVVLMFGGMQRLSEYAHSNGDVSVKTGIRISTKKIQFDRQEAIKWNGMKWNLFMFKNPDGCVRDLEADGWTKGLTGSNEQKEMRCISTGNGTAKVLIIGNSYAYKAFRHLHRKFAGRYSKMRLYARSGEKGQFLTENGKIFKLQKHVLEKFQPDITFLIAKDCKLTIMKPIVGKVNDDPITKQVQAAINILSKNSKLVVVDQQFYKPTMNVAYTIMKRLKMDKTKGMHDFNDLRVPRKVFESDFANEKARMATINNTNVIVNRVGDQLCPNEYCYFFNQENLHAYYGDTGQHLTTEGLEVLEPKYGEIIEAFLSRM